MSAFNTALSGIQAADSDLTTTGNNIANASTPGFKAAKVEFQDVYPKSLGTGSLTIGSGVRVSAVTQGFGQGNIVFDDSPLHLGINGSGFFQLNDGGTTVYSRAGLFKTDEDGYVVNSNGQNLKGFLANSSGVLTGTIGNLIINTANSSPFATTTLTSTVNLDARSTVPTPAFSIADTTSYNHTTATTIYDSLGKPHTMNMFFRMSVAANSTWLMYVQFDSGAASAPITFDFNTSGAYDSANSSVAPITIAYAPGAGAAAQTITYDFTTSTQFGSSFGVQSLVQNGYTTGRLASLSVDTDGTITGRFTNGQTRSMGQIQLANFASPEGLQPLSDSTWGQNSDSGAPVTGVPGSSDLGLLQSGAYEQSNTDLTEQLINLITAQRNYQANTKTIETSATTQQSIINAT